MKFSFTIPRKGKRYNPYAKPKQEVVDTAEKNQDQDSEDASSTHQLLTHNQIQNQDHPNMPGSSASSKNSALINSTVEQLRALGPSFSLNLFTNGYTFGNVEEFFQDVPENLNRYDRHAKPIMSEIEYGRLPVGINVGNMQWKYVNGTVLCEVRDYRDAVGSPKISLVPLKMGLGNIIEDVSLMPRKLTLNDQLKLEAVTLNSLHPHLNLDPKAPIEFCNEINRVINFGIDY